jgi:hypothetical protein
MQRRLPKRGFVVLACSPSLVSASVRA